MAEIVTCERCSRNHAARFARCPFCNAPRASVDDNAPFRANAPPPPVETRTPEQIEREARLRAAMAAMTVARDDEGHSFGSTRATRPRVWLQRAGAAVLLGGLMMVAMRCSGHGAIPVRGAEALSANDAPHRGFMLDARIDWKNSKLSARPHGRALVFAEVAGSGGRLYVAARRKYSSGRLYGHYTACPSKTCTALGDPHHADGYFVVARRWPRETTPLHPAALPAVLLGLLLLLAPLLARPIVR